MFQPQGFVDLDRPIHVCKLKKSTYRLINSQLIVGTLPWMSIWNQLATAKAVLMEVCMWSLWRKLIVTSVRNTWCVCRWYNSRLKRPCNAESRESCIMWKIWDDWSERYTLSSWYINQEIQRFKNIDSTCTVKSAELHVHRESTKEVWNGQTANLSLLHLGLVESFSSYLQGMSPLIFRPTNRQLDVWPTCQQQPERISLQQLESYPSIHMYTNRSTSGYEFQFANSTISWSSRKQPTVAKFSTEAECLYCFEFSYSRSY